MNPPAKWAKPFSTDPEVVAMEIACKLNFSTCEVFGAGGLNAREVVEERLRLYGQAVKEAAQNELERRRDPGGCATPSPESVLERCVFIPGAGASPSGAGDPPSGAGGQTSPGSGSAVDARAKGVGGNARRKKK